MGTILGVSESFDRMNRKFEELRQYDVIDLANLESRFPAIVIKIERERRRFFVVPLRPDCARSLVEYGAAAEPEVVDLPSDPRIQHPSWNKFPVQ
jgi:hypothetical protein